MVRTRTADSGQHATYLNRPLPWVARGGLGSLVVGDGWWVRAEVSAAASDVGPPPY